MVFTKVQVRVRSATPKELECAHVCVRTYIWTYEVRACDAKLVATHPLQILWIQSNWCNIIYQNRAISLKLDHSIF